MLSGHIFLDEIPHPVLNPPFLVKFNDPLCQMSLALAMTGSLKDWLVWKYIH